MNTELPKDLGGWQNVRNDRVRIGDIAVMDGKLSWAHLYWVQMHVSESGEVADGVRIYRKIQTPAHFHPEQAAKDDSDGTKAALRAERGKVYGDPQQSHANIGLSWTGLIQQHYGIELAHPLPSWLVAEMMVTFKMQRAARVYHEDNFRDGGVYMDFAEEGQKIDCRATVA